MYFKANVCFHIEQYRTPASVFQKIYNKQAVGNRTNKSGLKTKAANQMKPLKVDKKQ